MENPSGEYGVPVAVICLMPMSAIGESSNPFEDLQFVIRDLFGDGTTVKFDTKPEYDWGIVVVVISGCAASIQSIPLRTN